MGDDSEEILNKIKAYGGTLMMNDKSAPEDIKQEFQMSKKAFKEQLEGCLKKVK